jgi:hypothetical protein
VVNFIPSGQITRLAAKFTPRGEIHPWGPGIKLRMALCLNLQTWNKPQEFV